MRWLALPLPGPLAGMLLLFFALVLYKKVPNALDSTASFFINHLILLFIPAIAGVMLFFDRLLDEWLPFMAAGIFGTLITLLVTAYCLSWLLKLKQHKNNDNNNNNNE